MYSTVKHVSDAMVDKKGDTGDMAIREEKGNVLTCTSCALVVRGDVRLPVIWCSGLLRDATALCYRR